MRAILTAIFIISSTTSISPLEDQNFPPGGNSPPVGNHCCSRNHGPQWKIPATSLRYADIFTYSRAHKTKHSKDRNITLTQILKITE